ncbi:hypothetical protein [Ammonifex thiophilus]|uniref:Uncharacterized protein n=1 Tax=Ammonifex thiophilus TaxID=444093 RepID=A0A3D8P318_9THEO|nr:hypothetical protein [Ammonifex thiophilus]RDV81234.1 hypothetical protein DXX99_09630 [Ammonifex thiophilus]
MSFTVRVCIMTAAAVVYALALFTWGHCSEKMRVVLTWLVTVISLPLCIALYYEVKEQIAQFKEDLRTIRELLGNRKSKN